MTVFWDGCQRGILTSIQIKSHNMRYVFILMVFLCTSCGTALPTIKPYKLDVQQGNVVTSKMLLQLRPGMTKSQVRFVMGTPLIQDSFHGNRWDYVYQLRENGKVTEQRRVILDFENELLKRVRGDVVPSGSDASKPSADDVENIGTRVLKPYTKPEKKGLLNKLMFWEKDEAASPKAAVIAKPQSTNAPSNSAEKKIDIDSSAQKAANPVGENPAPASEEVKSVLVVPVEMIAAPESAAVVPVQPQPVEAKVVAPNVVETKSIDLKPSENKVERAPEPVAPFEPSLGMQFDRSIRHVPDVAEPEAKAAVVAPRAGNKAPPKPKDLPAEGTPGFFDKMLEKIGF